MDVNFPFVKWEKHSNNLHKWGNTTIKDTNKKKLCPTKIKMFVWKCHTINKITIVLGNDFWSLDWRSWHGMRILSKSHGFSISMSGVNPLLARLWLSVIRHGLASPVLSPVSSLRQKCIHSAFWHLVFWYTQADRHLSFLSSQQCPVCSGYKASVLLPPKWNNEMKT